MKLTRLALAALLFLALTAFPGVGAGHRPDAGASPGQN